MNVPAPEHRPDAIRAKEASRRYGTVFENCVDAMPKPLTTMTVAEIQRALLARGYDLGPSGADGDAGPRTIAAVTAFQRSAGLVADGIAGARSGVSED